MTIELAVDNEPAAAAPQKAMMIEVHMSVLRELLQLPPEAVIDGMQYDISQPGVIHIRVRGIGYDIKSNEKLVAVVGVVTRKLVSEVTWSYPPDSH